MKMTRGIITVFALLLAACTASAPKVKEDIPPPRWKIAEAMFQERCKKSGEFIHRTVEGVEGVYLLKVRPEGTNYGHTKEQQFQLDDPYGHDSTGDRYIKEFLYGRNANGYLTTTIPPKVPGYRYVEAVDPKDGNRYRYTGRIDQPWLRDKRYGEWVREFVLDKVPAPGASPRYGVTYDDISTHEEREYWIAGSSLKVIDLKTNEVIAERIGYMWDPGQGANGGGRAPWLMAADHACPGFKPLNARQPGFSYQVDQARNFVEKVLEPSQGR